MKLKEMVSELQTLRQQARIWDEVKTYLIAHTGEDGRPLFMPGGGRIEDNAIQVVVEQIDTEIMHVLSQRIEEIEDTDVKRQSRDTPARRKDR